MHSHTTNASTLFALVPLAREKRRRPTKSEAILWAQLRGRKVGVRFRRQHPFPLGYIVDFFAPCARLVVEVDGGIHLGMEHARGDAIRQREIEQAYGVRFVRVSAELVERDVLETVAIVRAALIRDP